MPFKVFCILLPLATAMLSVAIHASWWLLATGTVTASGLGCLFLAAVPGTRRGPCPLPVYRSRPAPKDAA